MLNTGQREALRMIKDWEAMRLDQFFILDGAAGVGKTYTLSQSGLPFIYTAPTNKAVKVLEANGVAYPQTIHQLLGLKLQADGAIRKLKQGRVRNISNDIVVIDEASMLSSNLLEYIGKQAKRGTRFLLLGDVCQLPPVNEVESPIWSLNCPRYTLTEQMRQNRVAQENGLTDYIQTLRAEVATLPNMPLRQITMPISSYTDRAWLDFILRDIDALQAGSAKVIAWRNKRVDAYNKFIRGYLYGTTNRYTKGDRLIVREAAFSPYNEELLAPTDTEGVVVDIDLARHPHGLELYKITIQAESGEFFTLYPIHENSEKELRKQLNRLSDSAKRVPILWSEYWKLRESVSQLSYAYAITAHKSQGSTYNNVYIDWFDIWRNPNRVEAGRCFYVAVSRARDGAYFGTIKD